MTLHATILLQHPSLFPPGTPGEPQLLKESRCGVFQPLHVSLAKLHLLDTVQEMPERQEFVGKIALGHIRTDLWLQLQDGLDAVFQP